MMVELRDDTLLWTFAAPLAASLALFAFARAPFLWARLLIALVAQGLAFGVAVLMGLKVLTRGGFHFADTSGWFGARLGADPFDLALLPCSLTAADVPLVVAVALAALLAIVLLLPHARHTKSSAPLAAVLAGGAFVLVVILARDVAAACGAFCVAGLCGFALLVSFHPRRVDVEGAVRAFILHRIGDALVLAGVVVVLAGIPRAGAAALDVAGLSVERLAVDAPALDTWTRLASGPFAGFEVGTIWLIAAGLVVAGASLRLALGPLLPLVRDAVGAPGAAVGFAHAVCFAGAALALLIKLTPLLWLAPDGLRVLGYAAAGSAVVAGALALVARDVVRIALAQLSSFTALVAVAVAAGDLSATLFGAVLVVLAGVPLCACAGVVVEATQRSDPHALGALERPLARTHTASLFLVGALFGPVFSGAVLAAHLIADALRAPWLGVGVAGVVVAALPVVAAAGFRPLHLVFTGKRGAPTREPLAAPVVDAPGSRTLPVVVAGFIALLLGLLHLPLGVVVLLGKLGITSYLPPFWMFLTPTGGELAALRAHVLPESVVPPPPLTPVTVCALAVLALGAGWLASTVVYRNGPGRLHARLLGGARVRRVVAAVAGVAGGEGQVVRGVGEGAIRLSRMIATNLAPGVLDTLLRRLPALIGFVVGVVVRFIANGSAQRGIVVALVVLLLLLWRLRHAP